MIWNKNHSKYHETKLFSGFLETSCFLLFWTKIFHILQFNFIERYLYMHNTSIHDIQYIFGFL